jgi:hypothetical protein
MSAVEMSLAMTDAALDAMVSGADGRSRVDVSFRSVSIGGTDAGGQTVMV